MKTRVVKPLPASLQETVAVLRRKGIIVYPTETCYGLGGDATDEAAIAKVFSVKNRPPEKKISAAVSSLAMIRKYYVCTSAVEKLAKAFMPGPLTIVSQGQAFRIPKNEFIVSVIEAFGKPITATSANISGQEPLYDSGELIKTFSGRVNLIVDAGILEQNGSSTVFDVDSRRILREGPISEQHILSVLKK